MWNVDNIYWAAGVESVLLTEEHLTEWSGSRAMERYGQIIQRNWRDGETKYGNKKEKMETNKTGQNQIETEQKATKQRKWERRRGGNREGLISLMQQAWDVSWECVCVIEVTLVEVYNWSPVNRWTEWKPSAVYLRPCLIKRLGINECKS